MRETTTARVARMIALAGVLGDGKPQPVATLAERFGVPEDRILADINTLWVSGLPGYSPMDLIDFDADLLDAHVVRLTQGHGISRPVRLGPREAITLLASVSAIRAMLPDDSSAAGLADAVLAKVSAVTGNRPDAIDIHIDTDPQVLETVRAAIASRRRLRLRYVRADDAARDRVVEPLLVTASEGHSYLVAFDVDAAAERLLRIDRILDVTVLDETFEPRPVERTTFSPDPTNELVGLHVAARARWIAEDIPTERVTELADGTWQVWLRLADPAWLRQLLLRVADDVLDVHPASAAQPAVDAAQAGLEAYQRLD